MIINLFTASISIAFINPGAAIARIASAILCGLATTQRILWPIFRRDVNVSSAKFNITKNQFIKFILEMFFVGGCHIFFKKLKIQVTPFYSLALKPFVIVISLVTFVHKYISSRSGCGQQGQKNKRSNYEAHDNSFLVLNSQSLAQGAGA